VNRIWKLRSVVFKKIVVPLDGSKVAEQALSYAVDMVKAYNGELMLLRACDLPVGMIDYCGQAYYELQAQSQDDAERYLERVRQSLELDRPVHTRTLLGHTSDSILAATEAYQADLVVMTSHGKSGIDRWLLGSVAESFARRSTCPVLVLRRGDEYAPPLGKKILVPLDGSELAEGVLPLAMAMAKRADGEVVLLRSHAPSLLRSYEFAGHDMYPHAEDAKTGESAPVVAKEYLAEREEQLQKNFIKARVSSRFSVDYAPEAILRTAEEEKVDLIAMTSHGATGIAKWVFGSVAEKILRHADCPILLLKSEWSRP
jgi:nucleotide-binding universal stress UspA family protein